MKNKLLSGLGAAAALLSATSAFAQAAPAGNAAPRTISYSLADGNAPLTFSTRLTPVSAVDDGSQYRVPPSSADERDDTPQHMQALRPERGSRSAMSYRDPKMGPGLMFKTNFEGQNDAGLAFGKRIVVHADQVNVTYSSSPSPGLRR